MFAATVRRSGVRLLLGIGAVAVVVAGCGTDAVEPAAETTTSATTASTTTTTSTSTTVVVTTEPQVETAPLEPTDEELRRLEEEIRADVIAFELAYWDFLFTGDVTLVQPFVDEGLYEGYVANVVPDLDENGLFREVSIEVDVPSVQLTDDLEAALVRFCYVSAEDLIQANEAGEETITALANEPYGVVMRVVLGEDGVWKANFGTPRPLIGTEFEETCAAFLGG